MKKNAILIAAIMFVAGCAHQQGGYSQADRDSTYTYHENEVYMSQTPTMTTETPSRAPEGRIMVEEDRPVALQHDPGAEAAGASAQFETNLRSENREKDIKADSSERGTSLRARGEDLSASVDEGPVTDQINPLYEADSSERGTSLRARGYDAVTEEEPSSITARNWNEDRLQATSGERGAVMPDRDREAAIDSEFTLEDENFAVEDRKQFQSATTFEEDGSAGSVNLNASNRLEENMTGEYDLDERLDAEAAGGPAGSQSESGAEALEEDLEDVPEDSHLLYNSNPAHGVGSLTAPNTAANSAAMVEQDEELASPRAREIKKRLTEESTGTYGLMSPLVARNIKVQEQDGVVTLSGTVPTERDKQVLAIRAKEIPGVKEVKNEIKVSKGDPQN